MHIRIALLCGCHLESTGPDSAWVHCRDAAYGADDPMPVLDVPGTWAGMTARDFVRESMRTLVGEDSRRWPAAARRFTRTG